MIGSRDLLPPVGIMVAKFHSMSSTSLQPGEIVNAQRRRLRRALLHVAAAAGTGEPLARISPGVPAALISAEVVMSCSLLEWTE